MSTWQHPQTPVVPACQHTGGGGGYGGGGGGGGYGGGGGGGYGGGGGGMLLLYWAVMELPELYQRSRFKIR